MLLSCSLLPNCISSICESLEIKSRKAALLYGSKVSLLHCCSEDSEPSPWQFFLNARWQRAQNWERCFKCRLREVEFLWKSITSPSLSLSQGQHNKPNQLVVWGHLLAILSKHWRRKNPNHLNYLQNIQKLFESPPLFLWKMRKRQGSTTKTMNYTPKC